VIGFGKFSVWLKNPSRVSSQWAHTSEWRREKSSSDIEFMSWVCAFDCVYSNAEKAYTSFPVEDFVLSMSVCNVSLCVYCTWFWPCYTSLSLAPARAPVLHVILPLLYVPFYLSQGVYCTWFRPCYTFLLPVNVYVLHVILLLTRMSLQHEPSFFLVSYETLMTSLIVLLVHFS